MESRKQNWQSHNSRAANNMIRTNGKFIFWMLNVWRNNLWSVGKQINWKAKNETRLFWIFHGFVFPQCILFAIRTWKKWKHAFNICMLLLLLLFGATERYSNVKYYSEQHSLHLNLNRKCASGISSNARKLNDGECVCVFIGIFLHRSLNGKNEKNEKFTWFWEKLERFFCLFISIKLICSVECIEFLVEDFMESMKIQWKTDFSTFYSNNSVKCKITYRRLKFESRSLQVLNFIIKQWTSAPITFQCHNHLPSFDHYFEASIHKNRC